MISLMVMLKIETYETTDTKKRSVTTKNVLLYLLETAYNMFRPK
jgi:hypothetical protein